MRYPYFFIVYLVSQVQLAPTPTHPKFMHTGPTTKFGSYNENFRKIFLFIIIISFIIYRSKAPGSRLIHPKFEHAGSTTIFGSLSKNFSFLFLLTIIIFLLFYRI